MKLRDAGYREKAFCKAEHFSRYPVSSKTSQTWQWLLDQEFNPRTDWVPRYGKVRYEGSHAKAILDGLGVSDKDCYGQ